MDRISRRQIVRGAAATAVVAGLGTPSVHAQKDRQTLRFVPHAELRILDPFWTTAYITRHHGYLVYDTLFGTDEDLHIKPQMVDQTTVSPDGMKYTFTLRDGLRWHDGQPVLSEDCTESLKRWGKKDRFGQLLMASTAKAVPVDKKTFTLELAEPFGPVLDALGKASSNVPFMMPARIASTPADQQIKEVVGSGPFKLAKDEWQPGEQAVYVRNPDYVPRDEPPSGSTGGKRAYLDKVIWRFMAEPWDAANDLAAGEVDWWEEPPLEFIPRLNRTRTSGRFALIRSERGLGQAELAAPAVQQQEGASGAALHDGPGDVPALVHWAAAILSALPFGLCLRRTLRDNGWCRAHDRARPIKSEAACAGVGLRRPPYRRAPRHRHSAS